MNVKEHEVQQMPTWRIVAVINFPVETREASPPAPGEFWPQKLTTVSRIPDGFTLDVDGISITLQSWPGPPLPPLLFRPSGIPDEPAALVSFTDADTPELAIGKMEPLLEPLLDSLSFQLQIAIRVFQLEALDVTPPVGVGMTRRCLLYPYPNGYPSAKFRQSIPLGNILTSFQPNLRSCFVATNTRIRAALRWYVKGLASNYEVDNFIFFWIALEILRSESGISVGGPYRAKCGHKIPICPNCGEQTFREELGKSIKAFLTKQLGIAATNANKLWEFRQMLHGANELTPQATSELPRMVLILRQAVVAALKMALGFPPSDPPLVLAEGPSISSSFAIGGTRTLDNHDVDLGLPSG